MNWKQWPWTPTPAKEIVELPKFRYLPEIDPLEDFNARMRVLFSQQQEVYRDGHAHHVIEVTLRRWHVNNRNPDLAPKYRTLVLHEFVGGWTEESVVHEKATVLPDMSGPEAIRKAIEVYDSLVMAHLR